MPCVSPLKRPQKTQEIPKSSQSRRKLFHPKPLIPSWTHLVNPASAVQGFCFCPEKLFFDTMDFVQKNTAQIPQIQHSMCKVVNQMEKTYIFIPIYLSKAGKSFMIDSWSFVKRFTSASVEVPPKKALRWRWCLWNARIARNNYGSVPISSGGELLPYLCLKGGRHCFDAMY